MRSSPAELARRIGQIGFSPTLAIGDLAQRLKAEGRDILDFSAGQPDFPSPEPAKNAARRAIDENRTRYTATAGIAELRTAIADRFQRKRGLTYGSDQILVSPGAKASLYFACMALLDPGDEALVPTPYWTSYPEQIRLAGADPVFVSCSEARGFKLSADELARAITPRTKLLLLNYPSNPTGACYDRQELEALAEVCVGRKLWVIADEIYSELLYDNRRFVSPAELGPEIADRTVVIDGMSKTYAMTGWRVGYAAGPREVIAGMSKLQSHSTSNVTSVSQWASVGALGMSEEELRPRLAEFERRRGEIMRRLSELPGVSCVLPGGAFYVFPNVSGLFTSSIRSGEDLSRYLLEQANVAVVPGEAFGSPEHVRFSYACSLDQIREGMARVGKALAALAVE